ncbi:MAG TPA: GMC family oxidoreductase [Burkholderiaceae bacterium]|nr:GMC family oxidoreductase [Burkholderiaceae bacterium]
MTNPAARINAQARVPDPIEDGLSRGWKVVDASSLRAPLRLECDVAIIGTGAGGGMTAELLTKAGLDVILIEEGPLKSSRDFKMRESDAYPALYWDSASRKTKDKAINILQGRAVGGSTTVNWTSSFRTPPATLAFWREHSGLREFTPEALAPYFEQAERRLGVEPWSVAPNENNRVLQEGAAALGVATSVIPRNVQNCWNLGYCGMGCPVNAKRSMLVTTLPFALDHGARLFTRLRALRFDLANNRVRALQCVALLPDGLTPEGVGVEIRARHYVVAGGAINSPALLLRSRAPDPHGLLGKRTFLHPTVISSALFERRIDAYQGAPQSIYSDHFLERDPIDGPLGFKLEVPPLHPVLFASTLHGFGAWHAELMRGFAHANVVLALIRDGFHPRSTGGSMSTGPDGRGVLDYPLEDVLWDAARRALTAMAEIQFAAGAKAVYPVHELAQGYSSFAAAKEAIAQLPMQPLLMRVVSAHVMGGCAMAADAHRGVVDARGRHFQVENLSVHDGSVFPTSIGANPQLSIYGIVTRMASDLATDLTKRAAPVLA